MSATLKPVGRVAGLMRYPVKSLGGETVAEARLGWHGFHGDRRYALQLLGAPAANGLPWASARRFPQLLLWSARIEQDEGDSRHAHVVVRDPDGVERLVTDPSLPGLLSEACGVPVAITHLARGTFDAMDVSLVTSASIASVGALVGRQIEPARFRANVLVEADASRSYPEDRWVGRSLALGEGSDPARVRVNRKDPRCRIVDFDPVTAQPAGDVFAAIVGQRKNLLGVYGSVERCGTVRVGDMVYERAS